MRIWVFILLFLLAVPFSVFAAVNINTANHETLMTLNGIGAVKAQAIIDYRTTNGPFQTIEEIQNVSGIGAVTFQNIKDFITVSGVSTPIEEEPDSDTNSSQETQTPEVSGGGVFIEDKANISVSGGTDRTVFVGADSVFEARVWGLQDEPLDTARVVWSFGNGDRKEGQRVLYHFEYPGTYVVVLDASSGKYGASDRVVVTAIPAAVAISEVTLDYVALVNKAGVELDLGGWLLTANGRQFQFPPSTILLSNQEVLVSNKRTGLAPTSPESVALLYPNGLVAVHYEYPLFIAQKTSTAPTQSSVKSVQAPAPEQEARIDPLSQMTSPALAFGEVSSSGESSSIFVWLLILFGLVIVGSVSVLWVRRSQFSDFSIEEMK